MIADKLLRRLPFRRIVTIAVCMSILLAVAAPSQAVRPSAMKLFPEETLLLVRTPNIHETVTRLKETSTGRMVQDPQLEKFIERLYGSAGDLYGERLAELLGVSWEELQDLPQGEMAFAIVARRDFAPAFLLLLDQGEVSSVARKLVDTAIERIGEQGGDISTETILGVEVKVIRDGNNPDRTVGLFEKENTIVASTDAGLLREVLGHWQTDGESSADVSSAAEDAATDGESSTEEAPQYGGRSLAENDKFVSILRHCRRPHDPPPNVILYADPIGLVRGFGRDNPGLKIAMATFPALGVDGLAAVGSTMTFATGEYDDLSHMHVLLNNPRAGVMQLIAFEPGETTPQPWVFADAESYMTCHWNVRSTFDTLRNLIDRFQFEGATQEFITDKANDFLGIDLEPDLIDNFGKRFSLFAGYEQPTRFRGQQSTISAEVVDPALAEETLAKIAAKFPERIEKRQFGDVTYYALIMEWPEQLVDDPPLNPFMAVMDGHLFFGGSCQLFERAIAARDGTYDRLADSPEYHEIMGHVERETPGVAPAMALYSNFEVTLRQWYDLLTSERTREFLDEHAATNPMFAALVEALDAEQLPPFDVLGRYTKPSGAVMYDTDTGFHMIGFTLRKDVVEP